MRKGYVCILLFISITTFSQKSAFDLHKKYPVKEILTDIDYTEKYLTKFHPDPYRYITKDSLHNFVLDIKAKIDTPLTEMQIRFYIKQIVSKIGCGHTDAGASKKFAKALTTLNRAALPLNTFITDTNRLFILNNLSKDSSIKAGDEVISIDGRSIKKILPTLYSVYSSDGYNTTHKKEGIRYGWFKYFYSFCFGYRPSYEVQIKNKAGVTSSHSLPALPSLKDTIIFPKKDSMNYLCMTKTCRYSLMQDMNNVAILDIDGFKGRHWRSFFRKSFRDIRKRKIQNVVIDLRDNGGGQVTDGLNLLSYMIHKPIFLPFDRKPNLMAFNPKFKMDLFSRITPLIFSSIFINWPKNGRLRHYFLTIPKRRNAFHGNIYVLINGKSFSMSGVVASYLKYKANATIIGEETGGNVAGSNAIISGKIKLPHSKIMVFIPMYHLYHDVNAINDGHGIKPDHDTHYSKDDILNGVDLDLLKVKELIR